MARNPKPKPLPPQSAPPKQRRPIRLTGLFSVINDIATARLALRDSFYFFTIITVYLLVSAYVAHDLWKQAPVAICFFVLARVTLQYESISTACILLLISFISFGSKLYPVLAAGALNIASPTQGLIVVLTTSTSFVALRAIEAAIKMRIYTRRTKRY